MATPTLTVKIPIATIINNLSVTCGLVQVSTFHQRGSGYGDGICRGICLDWIRRIMNGKAVFYKYDDPRSDKGKKRLALQARTQQTLDRAVETYRGRLMQIKAQRDEASKDLDSKREWGAWKFWTKSVVELEADLNQQILNLDHELNDFRTKGIIGCSYGSFASGWKETARSKTKQQKTSQFDAFTITQTPDCDVTPPDAFEAYVGLHLMPLNAGNCCMFGVTFANGKGHAVAAHYDGTHYFLFDPNFGIYRGSDRQVTAGLVYLFAVAYPSHSDVAKEMFAIVAT